MFAQQQVDSEGESLEHSFHTMPRATRPLANSAVRGSRRAALRTASSRNTVSRNRENPWRSPRPLTAAIANAGRDRFEISGYQ